MLRVAVVLPALIAASFAFGRGPPSSMCSLMLPKHAGIQQQRGPAPYSVFPQQFSYLPGERVGVVLRSHPDGPAFKGFVLGAHALNGDTEAVLGRFVVVPEGARGLSWYAEQQGAPNCVSHSSPAAKREMAFQWEAPVGHHGDVIFIAAFVRDFAVFWANVSSAPLRSVDRTPPPPFPSAIQHSLRPLNLQACGVLKGCLLYPRRCQPEDCEIVVTFRAHNGSVQFEITAPTPGYVSLAFSKDRNMGKDETISCAVSIDRSRTSIQHGYNVGHSNERHRIINFTNLHVARLTKTLVCRFQRPIEVPLTLVAEDKDFNRTVSSVSISLRKPWFVFLAVGDLYEGTDVIHKHTLAPIVSLEKVDLMTTKIFYASALPDLVQIHGIIMLLAWMLCAGTGTIIAANFKSVFLRQLSTKPLWLHLHRSMMALTVILILCGLGFIFVALLGDWSDRATIHGSIGLSSLAVLAFQVLLGVTGPLTQHPRCFAWVHILFGYGAHLLGMCALLLAFLMPHMPRTLRYYGIVILTSWIAFQVTWLAIFRFLRWCVEKGPGGSITVSFISEDQQQIHVERHGTSKEMNRILVLAFFFYCITAGVFFATCVLFILKF